MGKTLVVGSTPTRVMPVVFFTELGKVLGSIYSANRHQFIEETTIIEELTISSRPTTLATLEQCLDLTN